MPLTTGNLLDYEATLDGHCLVAGEADWETVTTCPSDDNDDLYSFADENVDIKDVVKHVLGCYTELPCCSEDDPHREHHGPAPLFNALLTEPLHPSDPRCRSAKAEAALERELTGLRKNDVWDEKKSHTLVLFACNANADDTVPRPPYLRF